MELAARQIIFLGGNGHCPARLAAARQALSQLGAPVSPLELFDVSYPGFDGLPGAAGFDDFLASVASKIRDRSGADHHSLIYGTGIGGLLALTLRSQGHFLDTPILLQAPVLWGLERRLLPRLMRLRVVRDSMLPLLRLRPFQDRFCKRYFQRELTAAERTAFCAGYARCAAAGDLFAWCNPLLLRTLEERFAATPAVLRNVRVWWGGRDRVVSLQELQWTELALEVKWPVRVFPAWGHYPMIDDAESWVRALLEVKDERTNAVA